MNELVIMNCNACRPILAVRELEWEGLSYDQ